MEIVRRIFKSEEKEPKLKPIDISGLPKERVLKALFDFAQPPDPADDLYRDATLSMMDAVHEVSRRKGLGIYENKFGEINGRQLAIDLNGTIFDPIAYNAINGEY